MDNPYVKMVERWKGHPEPMFDVPAFAADLARELGGRLIEPAPDAMDKNPDVEVNGVRLWFGVKSWGAGANTKVHVSALAPRTGISGNDYPYGSDYKMPDAYVSASRPMASIAKDIRRRVIEPAKAPLAKWAEHRRAVAERASSLVKWADEYRALGLSIRLENSSTRTGTFYRSDPTISGEFYADGSVSIRSMSMNCGPFMNLVAALYPKEGANA